MPTGLRTVICSASSGYVQAVRVGGGLRGLRGIVPGQFTRSACAPSFCDACARLIETHDEVTGQATGIGTAAPLPFIPMDYFLLRRRAAPRAPRHAAPTPTPAPPAPAS